MSSNASLCDHGAIRDHLRRVLTCPGFDASERNRRFLEYVVEETLEGRADRIKAYSIATSVFGRNDSFDPQQDAIVRIEAGRVRRSLEHFYLTSGKGDPLRITIPLGSYVPCFSRADGADCAAARSAVPPERPEAASAEAGRGEAVRRPVVHVAAFEAEGECEAAIGHARGICRHVIVGLTRFTDLAVAGDDPHVQPAAGLEAQGADFVLSGAVAVAEGRIYVEALLLDARTGQYIWSDYIEHEFAAEGMVKVRAEVADQIVRAVAQPSGVIFSCKARESAEQGSGDMGAFESVVRFHTYLRTFDRDQFETVRLGLERAIVADPYYAEAFACLSLMYTNSIRFGYKGFATALSPLRRAMALAQRAIQLSPRSSRAYLALATAYWFNGQVDSAFEALRTSHALNPNDMEVLAELGLRHALCGNWDEGVARINEAYRRNPALSGGYRIGLCLWHFVEGRYEDSLSEAWKLGMPGVLYQHVMVAVSAARLGRADQAQAALTSILNLAPDFGDTVVRDLEGRNVNPDTIEKILRGLQFAGLACTRELTRFVHARDPGRAVRTAGAAVSGGHNSN